MLAMIVISLQEFMVLCGPQMSNHIVMTRAECDNWGGWEMCMFSIVRQSFQAYKEKAAALIGSTSISATHKEPLSTL